MCRRKACCILFYTLDILLLFFLSNRHTSYYRVVFHLEGVQHDIYSHTITLECTLVPSFIVIFVTRKILKKGPQSPHYFSPIQTKVRTAFSFFICHFWISRNHTNVAIISSMVSNMSFQHTLSLIAKSGSKWCLCRISHPFLACFFDPMGRFSYLNNQLNTPLSIIIKKEANVEI